MECIWCQAFYKSKAKKAECFICKKKLVNENIKDETFEYLMDVFKMKK